MQIKDYLINYSSQIIDHVEYEHSIGRAEGKSEHGTAESLQKNILKLIENLRLNKTIKILDCGCDFGGLGNYLKKNAKFKYELTGFDFPGFDKKILEERGYEKIIEGTHISAVAEKFDVLVCNQVLEHIFKEELDSWICHMNHIANYVIISVPMPWHTFAWNKSYLDASRACEQDIDERLFAKLVGAIHKSAVTPRLMRNYGFKKELINGEQKTFFFTKKNNPLKEDYVRYTASRYYRSIYERILKDTIQNEPKIYKYMRVLISMIHNILYGVIRRIKK